METRKFKPLPAVDRLRELFDLDDSTGALFHRRGPYVGERADAPDVGGYRYVVVGGVRYWAHRVIRAMHTGIDPGAARVDHRNGRTDDNRPENLRGAIHALNIAHRTRLNRNNTSGHRGVSLHRGKWKARIGDFRVGSFESREMAADAAWIARVVMFGQFAGLTA